MTYQLALGRKCELGYGYNESLNRLVPITEKPKKISKKNKKNWEYFVYPFSANNIPHWVSFLAI